MSTGEQSLWRVVAPYYGAFVVLGLAAGFVGPALDEFGSRAGVSDAAVGLVFVAQGGAYLVGALGAGRLFDRLSGHTLLAAALGGVAVAYAALAVASPLWALLAVYAALGVATSAIDVGGNTLLVWSVPPARLVGLLNWLHLCFGIGALLSPAVVAVSLAISDGVGPACLAVAGLAAAGGVMIRAVPSPPRRARQVETDAVRLPFAPVLAICAFFLLYVGLEAGFVGWVYTYAVDSGATGDGGAALAVVAFWAGFCLSRVLAATAGRNIAPGVTLGTATVLTIVPVVVLLAAGDRAGVLWAGSALLGFALGPQFALMIAYAERHLTLSAAITARFIAAASVGALSIPWLIGVAMDRRGERALPFLSVAGALLVTLALVGVRATIAGRQPAADDRETASFGG